MNRSISQIWNQNNSLEVKIVYRCGYKNVFKGIINIKVNDLNNVQIESKGKIIIDQFKGQMNHTQVEFENVGGESKYTYKTFLSCNTTKPNNNLYENIGKIKHKGELKDQFVSLKNILTLDKNSSRVIEYNTHDKMLVERANKIDSLLRQSNKIPIIEERLNFIQNSFEKCIKHSHKVLDCYHVLSINSYKISSSIFDTILTYNGFK